MVHGTADGSSGRRPGGRNARVRDQILSATAELVARQGIAGFRYDEVAELAGVHRTSVYRNWPDREKLVAAALLQYAEQLASITDSGDLRKDLVDYLMGIASGLQTSFGRALEQAMKLTDDNPAVRQTVTMILNERGAALRHRVDLAEDRGELPAVDSVFLGEMMAGPVRLIINRGARPFTREDAERIVDVVLAGIRATAPPGGY
ncbi:TetR/AcrR family transcriptional regulator [Mycolicibacterium sp. XJ883]